MPLGVQNVVVTVVALLAAAVFLRRLVGARRSAKPSCPSCESGAPCAPAPPVTTTPEVRPLVLVGGTRKHRRP